MPAWLVAQESKPAVAVRKITPGKVIVPTERMRRIWGELISLDQATRTGTFRNESNDEVIKFTVMPYAELLHHATNGDLQDFRVGERAIFRLHENEQGDWVWLTYIQDEMNMLNGHKEYFIVDQIDPANKSLTTTWANADKSFIRQENVRIDTDTNTRYWKDGKEVKFSDIAVGDKLRTKTHGRGAGKSRVAWEVFLDEASLLRFQAEQKAVHAQRMAAEGMPGYVDEVTKDSIQVTLFREGTDARKMLKVGKSVRIAPAGVDRKPLTKPEAATVAKLDGDRITVTLAVPPQAPYQVTGLIRVWANQD